MTYLYLLCDAANAVRSVQLAECASHEDAILKAGRLLRPGISAVEVWYDAQLVGRVDVTGGAGSS